MDSDVKEDDFTDISVIGNESNTIYSAIYQKTKETICFFKSPQLSIEYALEFIKKYSIIKCDHILPIYKYYFHPNVTFITKFPTEGKPLPEILDQISEKEKLTILLQIIDTVRIFQSYNYYSTFFDINSIYVDAEKDFHIKFVSIFPIYISEQSFSSFKMNAALLFNIMKTILGKEKASFYFDESNFYQSASKILYNLIQQISKHNSTLNVNIIKYEDYFKQLIELANETIPTKIQNEISKTNEISNGQPNTFRNEGTNENTESTKNENSIGNDNSNDYENQILEYQYLCAISGINEKKYLQNLSNKNYPKGQFLYGYKMFNGIGFRKDQIHGAKYIKMSADSSYPEAQLYYSILLKEGKGIRQNMNQSMNYLKTASDNKCKEALVLYGHSISNTMPTIAIQCYKEAAARGSIEGFFYSIFSLFKSDHLKSGNKNNSINSIINFNITFCSNIPVFKNSYKNLLNLISLGYLKLMIADEIKENFSQFLYGFFYNQIQSIFKNSLLIEPFDVNDIYESNYTQINEKEEEFYLEKSMKNGNLYSMYVYAKILNTKGQIQKIYEYLKNAQNSSYKNIQYYYAKCIQNMTISSKIKKKLKIKEMINDSAKNECYEAINEEGEYLYETDTNSSWMKFYQAAKSGIKSACLKYGKYIIKSNLNKGKYFLKLCANEIPEAEYILSTYSNNKKNQMKHLKKAADKGFNKASYLFGFAKYNEGEIDTAINYFKKSSDSSSFLYLSHCLFLKNNLIDCSNYIKLAVDSDVSNSNLPFGICLYYGIGMNKNKNEAEIAFRRSSSLFNFIGIYNLAVCMEKGIGIKKMNQNEIYSFLINQKNNAERNKKKDLKNDENNKKQQFSTVLFNSSSDFGLSYIYLYLGYLVYLKGDLKEAKRYFKNAASKGNMTAAILFAKCIELTTSDHSKLCSALKIYRLVINHLSEPVFQSNSYASKLKRKALLCQELLKKRLKIKIDINQLKKMADDGDDQAQYFYGVYCFGVDDQNQNFESSKMKSCLNSSKNISAINNNAMKSNSKAGSIVFKNNLNESKQSSFNYHANYNFKFADEKNGNERSSNNFWNKDDSKTHSFNFASCNKNSPEFAEEIDLNERKNKNKQLIASIINANDNDKADSDKGNENKDQSLSFGAKTSSGIENKFRTFNFDKSNENNVHSFNFNANSSFNSGENCSKESKQSLFNFTLKNDSNSSTASKTNSSTKNFIHSFNSPIKVEVNSQSKPNSFNFASYKGNSSPFTTSNNSVTNQGSSGNENSKCIPVAKSDDSKTHSFSFASYKGNSNLFTTNSNNTSNNSNNTSNNSNNTSNNSNNSVTNQGISSNENSKCIPMTKSDDSKTHSFNFGSYKGNSSPFTSNNSVTNQGISSNENSKCIPMTKSDDSKTSPFNFELKDRNIDSIKSDTFNNNESKNNSLNSFSASKTDIIQTSCSEVRPNPLNLPFQNQSAAKSGIESKIRPFNFDIKSSSGGSELNLNSVQNQNCSDECKFRQFNFDIKSKTQPFNLASSNNKSKSSNDASNHPFNFAPYKTDASAAFSKSGVNNDAKIRPFNSLSSTKNGNIYRFEFKSSKINPNENANNLNSQQKANVNDVNENANNLNSTQKSNENDSNENANNLNSTQKSNENDDNENANNLNSQQKSNENDSNENANNLSSHQISNENANNLSSHQISNENANNLNSTQKSSENDSNFITKTKNFPQQHSSSFSASSSNTKISLPSKSEGILYLEKSASSGNDKAEEFLARCLLKGDGIKRDISRAVSLFTSSSEKGNGQAKNNLGLLHKQGIFVIKDDKAAFELFKEAAEAGNAAGLLHYAMCLMKGRGVELNISLALPPLRKARELGVPRASYILGLYYLNSDPNGGTEGMKLIKEAANLGYKKAKLILDL